MIDHLALQSPDPAGCAAFYVSVFAPLGVHEVMRFDRSDGLVIGLGTGDFPELWFGPLVDPGTRPVHLALTAAGREAVDTVHELAIKAGAEILHEPRVWSEYHPTYYGVFLRDPDGNNVEAVNHGF
jgi:catechol 2,3-dioxygenase-like lactoylglutathione lyase family enzyme